MRIVEWKGTVGDASTNLSEMKDCGVQVDGEAIDMGLPIKESLETAERWGVPADIGTHSRRRDRR